MSLQITIDQHGLQPSPGPHPHVDLARTASPFAATTTEPR
ncbi:hypothetical protein BC739_006695 [Kutzneria viridogrisea]|uniref:Uncharacterized protein n=1 Tax=Kutzneria viridogrisea TaxID=47990 RepID=A0ABR6BRG4_9PSEU|nr:hypothetical protein [Kutzneria viridogrisea]